MLRHASAMRLPLIALSVLLLTACGGGGGDGDGGTDPTPSADITSYRATATVGDFILIDVDHSAQTISYDNISNGTTGTVSYTENADGSYTVHTPDGDRRAFEIEDFGLVLEMHDTGPGGTTPSLVIAVVGNDPVTLDQLRDRSVNIMQFRTVGDGIEIGHATTDSTISGTNTLYIPSETSGTPFYTSPIDATAFAEHSSGHWIEVDEGGGAVARIVTTPSGLFFIDNPNGAQIALPSASSKAFQSAHAGTYRTIVYDKQNAHSLAPGAPELGTAQFIDAQVTISSTGRISATDPATGSLLIDDLPLVPLADDSEFYDGTTAKLTDPCHGLFVFQAPPGGIGPSQKSFVAFTDGALLLASYQDNGDGTYNYFYGFAMEVPMAVTHKERRNLTSSAAAVFTSR